MGMADRPMPGPRDDAPSSLRAEQVAQTRAALVAAGLAIVLTHNVWVANWRVLITLIGWLMLIRGAVRILAPEMIMGYATRLLRNKQIIPVSGIVTGVLGVVFCYFGYAA